MELIVRQLASTPGSQPVEIVERKGLGVRGVQGCMEEALRSELVNLPALRDAFLPESVEIL